MPREITTEYGTVSISEDAIATIAGVAATECYGIVGMASRKIKDGLAELLGRENLSRGVAVSVDGDRVVINLYIVVGYGVKISEVAHNVLAQVRYAVKQATGLEAVEVNIHVQGVKVGSGPRS